VFQTSLLLADLALIMTVAKLSGAVMSRLRQPPVVGEILAGVLLGPTLLAGSVSRVLVPTGVRGVLGAVATVGLVLFMLGVGHELDPGLLRGRVGAVTGIAVGSVVAPLALGAGTAVWLASRHHPRQPVVFVLFVAVATSITALPVLARIITDRALGGTRVGNLAVASASAVDAIAWTLLAGVVALAGGGSAWRPALFVPYTLVMVAVVRPLLKTASTRWAWPRESGPVPLVAALLVSAAATEWLGLHYVFGALVFGAVLPRNHAWPGRQIEALRPVSGLLLPVFFVVAALNVNLSALGLGGVGELAAILAAAVVGKIAGAYLGGRAQRAPKRDVGAVAVLMNARGVTELVVLQLGLQIGVLDVPLYSLMVTMALLTTAMTGPMLTLVQGRRRAGLHLVPPAGAPLAGERPAGEDEDAAAA
jgi:K+:H+ antiporter